MKCTGKVMSCELKHIKNAYSHFHTPTESLAVLSYSMPTCTQSVSDAKGGVVVS